MKPRLLPRLFHTTHLGLAALWLVQLCLLFGLGPAAQAQVAGPGSALNLNGSTGYILATNNVWFSGDFTVEAWVFVRSYNNWSRLIDFGNGANSDNVYVALTTGTGGKPIMGVFTNATPGLSVQAPNPLPLNQWTHLATTLSGTNGTIYINGNPVASGPVSIPLNVVRTNNYIGKSNFPGDALANAIFDEVRIWNVARTQSQIQANLGRSLSGTETNLFAYWRFDEGTGTLADSSSNGQGATVQGGVTWTNSTAPILGGPAGPASAISFDGSTGYGLVPSGNWFNSDFSVEAWVYLRTNSYYATLIDFSQGNSDNVSVILSAPVAGGGYSIMFQIISNGLYYPWLSTPTNTLPLREWVHLAVTLSGTAATIYTNGSVAAFYDPLPLPPAVVRDSNFIGRGPAGGASSANAMFDELRIWNVARTQGEIRANMHRTLVGSEPGLAGYWRFDEGAGNTVSDSSGNGQTATLFGGSTWTNSTAPIAASAGSGLAFNAASAQAVSIPNQAALNAYPLTVMTWFEAPTTSLRGGLVNKYVSSSFNGYQLFMVGGHLQAWYIRDSVDNVFSGGPMDAGVVNDGLWHHAAMVIDATGGRLYLDGTLKSSLPWTGTAGPVTTTQPVSLGVYQGDSFWSGQLDEVSIWNTNLSTAQIQAAMNHSLAGTEAGLLGYWRLDEGSGTTTADSSGQGNTGTLGGSPTWVASGAAIPTAEPGYSLNLNGSGSYIQLPTGIWFSNAFTVEGWVFARSYNNWSRLFDFGNAGYLQEVYLALSEGTGGYPKMGIFTNGNTTLLGSTNQLPTNQWAHLAATFDGTNAAIYINGVLSGSGPLPNSPGSFVRTNNYFGRSLFAGDAYANAAFDEIRIWNVARTQAQIQQQMKRSLSGNEAGLVGYWRFDEGNGTLSADATGAGNAATLVSGPTWQLSTIPMNPLPPLATTLAANPVTPNTATLNGSINPNGAATGAWFDYGTTITYGSRTANTNLGTIAAPISLNLNGLLSGTLYHFRAAATNSAGTNFGFDQTFTTAPGTNAGLSALALSTGTLAPAFNSTNLNYSTTISNGLNSTVTLIATRADNMATLQFSINGGAFSNLTSGVPSSPLPLVVGTNSVTVQVTSGDTFNTQLYSIAISRYLLPPAVATQPPSGISSNAATFNTTVNPNASPTFAWFEWGATTAYGNFTPTQSVGSGGVVNPSQFVSGLTVGATYHYRAVATNDGGRVNGLDQVFRTPGLFVVTNLTDSGSGTLRALVSSSISGDTILLTNSITLLSFQGPIGISNNITIAGPATGLAAISGGFATRVFYISNSATVSMIGLNIQNGRAPGGGPGGNGSPGFNGYTYSCSAPPSNICYACGGSGYTGSPGGSGQSGGGIYNEGTLKMTSCLISGNYAGSGGNGGIGGPAGYNPGGPCGPTYPGNGGAGGYGGTGGGIYSLGTLIMNNCSVVNNQGGAFGYGGSGYVNGANGYTGVGAGIAVFGPTSLTNCTFAQNNSGNNAGAGIYVGYNGGAPAVTLVACTITANTAATAAGIYNYLGSVSLRNTIVADNPPPSGPPATDLYGAFISGGHNLISRTDSSSSGMNGPGDIVGTLSSPRVAYLSYLSYYGPTPVCPPQGTFSPAVDAGDAALLNAPFNLLRDQSGRSRFYGHNVDIGAAEYIFQCSIQNAFVTGVYTTNATVAVYLDSGGTPSGANVQYGTNTSYGNTSIVSNQPAGFVGPRYVYFPINNLLPGTLYHYRPVMTNLTDTFTYPDQTFTTISTNALLSALTLSSGDLSPAFDPAILNYTATAAPDAASVTVTATRTQTNAFLRDRINAGSYTPIPSGSPGNALPLKVGTNSVDVNVIAQDDVTTTTYNIALAWNPPIPAPSLTGPVILGSGAFQFSFTNLSGAPFSVWASDDLSLPLSNWFSLGSVTDNPAGFFQFTDPTASNAPQRFYNVRSP